VPGRMQIEVALDLSPSYVCMCLVGVGPTKRVGFGLLNRLLLLVGWERESGRRKGDSRVVVVVVMVV